MRRAHLNCGQHICEKMNGVTEGTLERCCQRSGGKKVTRRHPFRIIISHGDVDVKDSGKIGFPGSGSNKDLQLMVTAVGAMGGNSS